MDRHSDRHHIVDIQLGCTDGAGKPTSDKAADGLRVGSVLIAPAVPPPSSEYWYHGDTAAANSHDEQQHDEARDGSKKKKPRYYLWLYILCLYLICIGAGSALGKTFADAMKGGEEMKLLGFALGMCIPVSLVNMAFCPLFCLTEDEDAC